MDEMTHKSVGNRRYGVLACFGALTISLALVACTAGSTHGPSTGDVDVAAVEAPDAMLVSAPESLLHLSEADLKSTMGEPEFVWEEAGASMWRYDATGCAVFVYLYPDGVRHVDVRGEGLSASERSDCFHDMVVSRAKS